MLHEEQLVKCNEEEGPGEGEGGAKQGAEVAEIVAFRYPKDLELEKSWTSDSCQQVDSDDLAEARGKLLLFHYRECRENLCKCESIYSPEKEWVLLVDTELPIPESV